MPGPGPTPRIGFAADREGVLGIGATLGLLALVVIPLAFFALLWVYLRKVSPEVDSAPILEGTAVATGAAPEAEPDVSDEARPCPRCSVVVRPHERGESGAECPNCGAPLFVQLRRVVV